MSLSLSIARRVLITGAGSGIGHGMAVQLALKHGWGVIATDLKLEAAENTAHEIVKGGGKAEAYQLDVGNNKQIQELAKRLQRVEVLVNNAGLQHVARLEDFPAERWAMMIQVMLMGAADLTRALLPAMRLQGYGRIVNIGSIHSNVGSPYKSAYVAAKHGLVGFSKVMALETGDVDITINTLCPSYVHTPLVDQQIADQAKSHGLSREEVINKIMLSPMPKKAFIGIDELVGSTIFLSSDAAKNISGHTINIDGGWTCR